MDDTKEFLREVSEQASDVAGTAANALGANIPEANKVFPQSEQAPPFMPLLCNLYRLSSSYNCMPSLMQTEAESRSKLTLFGTVLEPQSIATAFGSF